MYRRRERLAAVLVVTGLTLVGCSRSEDLGEASDAAAQVEPVAGRDVSRVTLTALAVLTLGIRTERVRAATGDGNAAVGGTQAIPYSAVLYDTKGRTSVYAVTGKRAFERVAVSLDRVEADGLAYLSQDLDPGTRVVTVGAPELLGAEEGVGGE